MNQKDKHGRKQGYWEEHWDSDHVDKRGHYKNDKRHGPWEFFWYEGEIAYKEFFINDRLSGIQFCFDEWENIEVEFYCIR